MILLQKRGKRKTQDPCNGCGLHKDFCLCNLIPTLNLKTKISLIVHAKELKRTTNTGRLALKALTNSEMKIRGEIKKSLDLTQLLSPSYHTFLFYPSDNAIELNSDLIKNIHLPIQLIVPDGNWRQASKVHYRHSELKNIPRVKIGSANNSSLHMRAEHTKEGMATLQAIAEALGIIEGPHIKDLLMQLYTTKLKRTLKARGLSTQLLDKI